MPDSPTNDLTEGQIHINTHRAATLRHRADSLTQFRRDSAPVIGTFLAIDNGEYPLLTIVTTALTAASEGSDVFDGKYAREGAALLGEPTTVEGGEDDQKADKKKFLAQMLGLVARTVIHEKDYQQGSFIGVNGLIQVIRDRQMAKTREEAIGLGIESKARKIGKLKGAANGLGAGLHTITPILPEKLKKPAQQAGNVALSIGTVLSLAGLVDMKVHVRKSKHRQVKKQDA